MSHNLFSTTRECLPQDAMTQAARALTALNALFEGTDSDAFDERTQDGLHVILSGLSEALDDWAEIVKKINDPYAAGFREGMECAGARYSLGVAEGIDQLRAEIEHLHPEWAREYLGRALENIGAQRQGAGS